MSKSPQKLVVGDLCKVYYLWDEFSHIWVFDKKSPESFVIPSGSVVMVLKQEKENTFKDFVEVLVNNRIVNISKKDTRFEVINNVG